MIEKSDLELVELVKRGEKWAFAKLVGRHQKSMLRLVFRLLREQSVAEDVVQESFLKAYQKIGTFEYRSSFKSWLYQIALNTARNRFRDKHRTQEVDTMTGFGVSASAESELVQRDVRSKLQREIEMLPDRQRTALLLRIFDDLSFKEIADIMNCPYDTAKANYRHALLKLKSRLECDENRSLLQSMQTDDQNLIGFPLMEAEI